MGEAPLGLVGWGEEKLEGGGKLDRTNIAGRDIQEAMTYPAGGTEYFSGRGRATKATAINGQNLSRLK